MEFIDVCTYVLCNYKDTFYINFLSITHKKLVILTIICIHISYSTDTIKPLKHISMQLMLTF